MPLNLTAVRKLAFLAFAALLCSASLFGDSSATLVGTVRDASGAVVPRASIELLNQGTGATRTTSSDDSGNYLITELPIGSYRVRVQVPGFKQFVQNNIVLDVDQTGRVDVLLRPGEASESITVDGSAPVVESEQSSMGEVIDNRTIVELPLNGRNFIELGSLVPGATGGAPGNSVVTSREGGAALTVNGQRAEYNNFTLDGLDNNETLFGVAVVVPSIDAIQQFKVETSNYSAANARGSGAVVNIAIKSGTNDIHGALFEFLRNDILDARPTFSASNVPLRRNQYGFAIGGPVYLPYWAGRPHVYRGRNKTFWFADWEQLKLRQFATQFFTLPSVTLRTGNFGKTATYDPMALDASGNRTVFPNDQIPASRIGPISTKVLAEYPIPNTSVAQGNYTQVVDNPTNNNQINLRADENLTPSDLLFVRYSLTGSVQLTPSINLNSGNTTIDAQSGVIGYTRIVNAHMVNDLKIGVQRYIFDLLPEGLGTNYTAQFGLPVFTTNPSFFRAPTISISNYASYGGANNIPVYRADSTYQLIDSVSLALGRHALKFGGDIRVYHANNSQPQQLAGSYSFTGVFTGATGKSFSTGLGDFLLGLPVSESILNTAGYDATRLRNTRFDPYIQDDFQVSARLTINMGLRLEGDGSWREASDRFAYFNFQTGQLVYPKAANLPFSSLPYPYSFANFDVLKQPALHQFAPRFGFAFRPFNDNKTVVRSAYGVFWAQPVAVIFLNSTSMPPYVLTQTATSGSTTPQLQFGVFPGVNASTLIPVNPTFFMNNPYSFRDGYVQQWNFGIERQLFGSTAISISYVGNKGTHLEGRREGNPALPPAAGAVNARRIYPKFQSIDYQSSDFVSSYNALQVSARKRYGHGLVFIAGYTYSKSLDDSSSWDGVDTGGGIMPEDPTRLFLEKGRSAHDVRHRATLSGSYEIPLQSRSRWLNPVIHGWQTSGIVTLQTGFPFGITVPTDVTNASTGLDRADLVGNFNLSDPTPKKWFNAAAFVLPAAYTFGTAGRNIVTGPPKVNADIALSRVFPVGETRKLQFRGEFFDLANHPNYGMPVSSLGSSAIASISSASSRISQLGLKFIF